MEVFNYVKNFIQLNGFGPTTIEICSKLDIKSRTTANKYINQLVDMGFLKKVPGKTRAITLTEESLGIPILGTIAAGQPILATENYDDTFDCKRDLCTDNTFIVKIKGESMIDMFITDGDLAIIERCDVADNGDIVAVLIDDYATLKRFFKEDGYIRLHPENSKMDDITVNDCKILGKLKGLIRKY